MENQVVFTKAIKDFVRYSIL